MFDGDEENNKTISSKGQNLKTLKRGRFKRTWKKKNGKWRYSIRDTVTRAAVHSYKSVKDAEQAMMWMINNPIINIDLGF